MMLQIVPYQYLYKETDFSGKLAGHSSYLSHFFYPQALFLGVYKTDSMRFLLSGLLIFFTPAIFAAPVVKIIPFGKNGSIRYDLQTGVFDVKMGRTTLLKGVSGSFRSDAGRTERMPAAVEQSENIFVDRLGMGKRYVFTGMAGSLRVSRFFYVYEGINGFYTEVVLAGQGAGSREIKVLDAHNGSGYEKALIVPFDNDTWVKYRAERADTVNGVSSEVTVLFNKTGYRGLIIGSATQTDWKTGIVMNGRRLQVIAGFTDRQVTRDVAVHGRVSEGDTLCRSPRILLMAANDWRDGMERYAAQIAVWGQRYNMKPFYGGKPFAWNSWGSMQTKLSLAGAQKVNSFFADSIPQFRSAAGEVYIDLDSYWDNLAKGGMTGDFSQLTAFCEDCRRKGLKPGIYWAPFVDWGKNERPVEGSSWNYKDTWTRVRGQYHELGGCRAMDPTHPGTRDRIACLIKRFKECGFEMIKIDFIGHAAIEADHFYDTTVHTGMQAFRKGMEYLCDQLGNQMLIYAAISPNIATARYVHMRRIACDAFKSINETSYTLNGTTFGWWLRYLYNYIDADHVVFDGETPGANRARLASAIVTGSVVLGDDFSVAKNWSFVKSLVQLPGVLEVVRQTPPFIPVDFPGGDGAAQCFISSTKDTAYLAVFNYGQETAAVQTHALLPATAEVTELFSGQLYTGRRNKITLPPADAAIFRIVTRF